MSTDQVLFGVGPILVLAAGLQVLASRRAQGRAPWYPGLVTGSGDRRG